jgi:hypothetical protein
MSLSGKHGVLQKSVGSLLIDGEEFIKMSRNSTPFQELFSD